ncbi:hypothetical protein JVT61DRAFT_13064 [Boletus reticuloceps]|uniref:Uncharacterized protein n=1 Tax=Boletus reticuloceps TaxID=495285 RepID=A0A8I3AB31_9AGAM|nr:hypothetical protein JVT61DRAFT_13064 [Boletus reticuloceps]
MSSHSKQKQAARTIVAIREQLQIIEKKKDYLQKKIGDNLKKAKANVVSNKEVAIKALCNNQEIGEQMERLNGQRLQLEQHINTLESANFETIQVMKKASDVLEQFHGRMLVSFCLPLSLELMMPSEDRMIWMLFSTATELMEVLAELEQAELDERLAAAEHVPSGAREAPKPIAVEDDEEAQLKKLQAALGM